MTGRFFAIAVLALCTRGALADTVERRGGAGVVSGRILEVGDDGVSVQTALGVETVPWDRVLHVEPDAPDPRLDEYLAVAPALWRARSRLERRDFALAEPLFERLFDRFSGGAGETTLVVAEGLLRCRLARGAHAAAVIPALETARLRRAGVVTGSYADLGPVLDESLDLVPTLAPAWVAGRGLDRLDRELSTYDAQGDAVVGALAAAYRDGARRQSGLAAEPPPDAPSHPGVEFIRSVVALDDVDGGVRTRAETNLDRRLRDLPAWCEAWARFFEGRADLRQEGVGRRRRGLVALAGVPALFEPQQPYLAGCAVALIADELERQGDADAAARLRAELRRRHPNHPIHTLTRRDRPVTRSEDDA